MKLTVILIGYMFAGALKHPHIQWVIMMLFIGTCILDGIKFWNMYSREKRREIKRRCSC